MPPEPDNKRSRVGAAQTNVSNPPELTQFDIGSPILEVSSPEPCSSPLSPEQPKPSPEKTKPPPEPPKPSPEKSKYPSQDILDFPTSPILSKAWSQASRLQGRLNPELGPSSRVKATTLEGSWLTHIMYCRWGQKNT